MATTFAQKLLEYNERGLGTETNVGRGEANLEVVVQVNLNQMSACSRAALSLTSTRGIGFAHCR